MNASTASLQITVDTEIALLRLHEAGKNDYIAKMATLPGQNISTATNSWVQQREAIQNRLDAAIGKIRDITGVK